MAYKDFVKVHEKFLVKYDREEHKKLPPGHYELEYIPDIDQLMFSQIDFKHDELLELPSKEFKTVSSQIDTFLTKESREAFNKFGFIYKRSVLMHGVPGTGKTCLVNRIANKVVGQGGIVLFNPKPGLLPLAFKAINDIQPGTNIVVVFEELDALVRTYEEDLLSLLDGEVQTENVIYIATTNFINKVPARIMRPGRFSSVVEVKYPDIKARRFYLNHKIGKLCDKSEIEEIIKATKGFSIDELKEVVLSTKCLQIKLEEVCERIKTTKELTKNDAVYNDYDDWEGQGDVHGGSWALRELTKKIKNNNRGSF